MRTFFDNLDKPKALSRNLSDHLAALPLMQAQEWVAQICGYRSWHDLREVTLAGGHQASPFQPEWNYRATEAELKAGSQEVKRASPFFHSQISVLGTLLAPYGAQEYAEQCWMNVLHSGAAEYPRAAHFGKGSPLYNELQRPWFVRESDLADKACLETFEGEEIVGVGPLEGWQSMLGFQTQRQLEQYYSAITNTSPEILRATRNSRLRQGLSKLFPLDGGGSDIRCGLDANNREAIQQDTMYRFWMRDPKGKILAVQKLYIVVGAVQSDALNDVLNLTLTENWRTSGSRGEVAHQLLLEKIAETVVSRLEYFIRCRVAQEEGKGVIRLSASKTAPFLSSCLTKMRENFELRLAEAGFTLPPSRFEFLVELRDSLPLVLVVGHKKWAT